MGRALAVRLAAARLANKQPLMVPVLDIGSPRCWNWFLDSIHWRSTCSHPTNYLQTLWLWPALVLLGWTNAHFSRCYFKYLLLSCYLKYLCLGCYCDCFCLGCYCKCVCLSCYCKCLCLSFYIKCFCPCCYFKCFCSCCYFKYLCSSCCFKC